MVSGWQGPFGTFGKGPQDVGAFLLKQLDYPYLHVRMTLHGQPLGNHVVCLWFEGSLNGLWLSCLNNAHMHKAIKEVLMTELWSNYCPDFHENW